MKNLLVGLIIGLACAVGSAQIRNSNGTLMTPTLTGVASDVIRGDGTVGTAAGLPSGAIVLLLSGSCPTGYSQSAALNGKTLLGTVAANGDAGTTGGADTITPTVASLTAAAQTFTGGAGTVPAEVFTGSSATSSATSGGTPAGTNSTVTVATTTGSKAGTSAGAFTAIAGAAPGASFTVGAETFTGSALATHTHTLTATGTNGTAAFTPSGTNGTSAVTGTLNSLDNRSAFVKVIFCQAN